MKLRDDGVAAQALLSDVLMSEQVAVLRSVRAMTGRAAVDTRCRMLEDERPALVGVTLEALRLLETAEHHSRRSSMGIVARRAFERAFDESVALIELEGCELVLVAVETQLARRANPADLSDVRRYLAQQRLR